MQKLKGRRSVETDRCQVEMLRRPGRFQSHVNASAWRRKPDLKGRKWAETERLTFQAILLCSDTDVSMTG